MFESGDVRLVGASLLSTEGESCDVVARVDRISGWERLIAHAQACQLAEMVEFAEKRRTGRARLLPEHAREVTYDGVNDEVAMARGISSVTAAVHLNFAQTLITDLPFTFAALRAGELSLHAARVIVSECDVLHPEQRRVLDEAIALEARMLTPGQVRDAIRTRVLAADPNAAAKRAARARSDVRVGLVRKPDGVGMVFATLPAEQALSVVSTLDEHARRLRGAGDQRSLQQIMADAFTERLTGVTPTTASTVRLNVVVSAATLLGLSNLPATLTGYGALSPAVVSDIVAGADTWVRRLITDPVDGEVLSIDSRARRVTGLLRTFVKTRDQVCRRVFCNNPIAEADHIREHANGGRTRASNTDGLCGPCHRSRHRLGWRLDPEPDTSRVWWTTPTGHSYPSDPPPALGNGTLDAAMLKMVIRHRTLRQPAA